MQLPGYRLCNRYERLSALYPILGRCLVGAWSVWAIVHRGNCTPGWASFPGMDILILIFAIRDKKWCTQRGWVKTTPRTGAPLPPLRLNWGGTPLPYPGGRVYAHTLFLPILRIQARLLVHTRDMLPSHWMVTNGNLPDPDGSVSVSIILFRHI